MGCLGVSANYIHDDLYIHLKIAGSVRLNLHASLDKLETSSTPSLFAGHLIVSQNTFLDIV